MNKANLEIDVQGELAADLEMELEAIEESIWDNFDWQQYGAEITEQVSQHAYYDDAMVKFMRGDQSMLIAICTDMQTVVVKRLAKEQQKAGQ